MKATQLPNRVIVLGKDMPHKVKVSVSFTDANIAIFEQFTADNKDEYTPANYPNGWSARRQYHFDIAAYFNPTETGQTFDIRTKFYKEVVTKFDDFIYANFK